MAAHPPANSVEDTEKEPKSSIDKIDEPISTEQVDAYKARVLQEKEPAPIAVTTLFKRTKDRKDLNEIATQPSVYDDPRLARFFHPTDKYENLHRFDPSARWTWAEELPLVRRLDWKVTLWAAIAFFALDLDRGNLSQANTDNFLEDLGMNTNDFNLGNTVFRLSFLFSELPSQLISKKLGPDRWIPSIMCLWSVVAAAQFWLQGRASFLACRALLGLLQGGFIPDVILYLSYFFKSTELPFRLALFWLSLRVADIVAPLLAFGLLRLRGVEGHEGWRWLFLIEGLITLTIGIWSWFNLVPSPTQTKTWYNKKGWFTEREETILVNRILRDDPSKGDMHNRQGVELKPLWKSLLDFDLWPIYIFALVQFLPSGPPETYLTLSLRSLGFSRFDSNLLTIPAHFLGGVTMLIGTYLSEAWNTRAYFGLFAQCWMLPNLIALYVLPASTSAWAKYSLLTVLLSFPSAHAIQVAWCSRNSNTVRTRTVSAALYNIFNQFGGIIGANIYRDDDKPLYRRGNKQLVALCCMNICLYILAKIYYVWRNKQRDREWSAMTPEQQVEYLETTQDTGSRRKDFRFAH